MIISSFQAKTGGERPRNGKKKKKISVPISSDPTRSKEFQKNSRN